MLYTILTLTLSIFSIVYLIWNCRNDPFRNPVSFFVVFQLIGFWGTTPLLKLSNEVDKTYYFIYFWGILFSIIGFILGDFFFPVSNRRIVEWRNLEFLVENGFVYNTLIKAMVVFSAVVCIIYFVAVGYNVFLLGFTNLISGGGETVDISGLRLASYNSEVTGVYYYPGFVNQFKDTLFPLCIFYLWGVNLIKRKKETSNLFLTVFSIISVICILGTGQRGAFAIAMMTGCAFIINVLPKEKRRKFLFIVSAPAIALFMVSTFINGRTSSETFETGSTLAAMWQRIASDNQWGAVIGFREVMYPNGVQWGSEWWEGIKGFTPSHKGSTLANDIAQVIWGGYGNVPPSNWGSIYYNFSWLGIALYPITSNMVIKYFYKRFYTKKKYLFRILIYTYAYLLYGAWIGASPFEFYFNIGLVTICILKILYKLFENIFGRKYIIKKPS
jgi:oligosaccharide repeat unit polymerase